LICSRVGSEEIRPDRAAGEPFPKRLTLEELLDDVGRAVVLADVVDGGDVRMVQDPRCTRFLLESFQVGGAKVDNMSVVVADFFAMLSHAVGAKLDGIVGYNFLRNYKVVIDYPNEVFSLF